MGFYDGEGIYMNRVDKLIVELRNKKKDVFEQLKKTNPLVGVSCNELLDMMCPEHPRYEEYRFNTIIQAIVLNGCNFDTKEYELKGGFYEPGAETKIEKT